MRKLKIIEHISLDVSSSTAVWTPSNSSPSAAGCCSSVESAVEDGIFLEFLLDAFLEGHDGQLQDLHGLDDARARIMFWVIFWP